ncbi:MAG TPA: hypothetical protein VN665_00830 [Candidatus Paceibacterota bacterium]|nr:hypothetical protein [Candidatus Paceibacterota bacterium]
MLLRGIFLITFAVCIDLIQLALGWITFAIGVGLQALTPFGGALAGAAAGGYACFSTSGGIIQGIADASKCVAAGGALGALASTFGIPFGSMLGLMLDICISLTLGSGLIFLLAISGMFYPKYVWTGGIFEMMPGFDILPGWTVMVILCLLQKKKEEELLIGKASTNLATMVAPDKALGTAFKGLKTVAQAKTNMVVSSGARTQDQYKQTRIDSRQELKTNLKNIDGIKPVGETPPSNQPYVPKAA